MIFDGRTYSTLIVSASEKFGDNFSALFPQRSSYSVYSVTNIAAAKRAVLEQTFDFVIINAPLPDDFGSSFAVDCCENKGTAVLLAVKAEVFEKVNDLVVDHGVFTVSKPISVQTAKQALNWMTASREKMRLFENKTVSIEDKMAEIRTVNRAKWLLIDSLKMTEQDAHRYIEKQAMDRCVSKKEIAETIIKTYS